MNFVGQWPRMTLEEESRRGVLFLHPIGLIFTTLSRQSDRWKEEKMSEV